MSPTAVAPVAAPPGGSLPGLEFAPGSNPSGDLSFADWRFLLPRLHYGTVLVVGAPPLPVLAALARSAGRVLVAGSDHRALRRVHDAARARGVQNVHPLRTASPASLPCAAGSVDLLALCDPRVAAQALASTAVTDELSRVVAADGTIYLEVRRHRDLARARRCGARLAAAGFDAPQAYWLLRRRPAGVRLAVPVAAPQAVRYAFDHVLYGTSRKAELLRLGGRLAARTGLHRWLVPDRALLFHRGDDTGARERGRAAPGPAHYLGALARRAGVELGRFEPAFFARGAYDSNKVAFFLFGDGGAAPAALVKLTRAPRYNHRLEAEYNALVQLRARGLADAGTYPEALFLERHHDLAVLAQRVVPGSPFRTRTRGDAGCPFVQDAVAWIEELGARSAAPPTDARALPQTLDALFTRFDEIYALEAAERSYLRACLGRLGAVAGRMPTVFQHGDAGTWNALVTPDDRVAFLDWEVSSALGVPLWDLVDFLRSFGSWVARARGERDMVRAYATHFLDASPLSELQARVVRGYCERLGVPREGVEGLFFACWMQRAVREAAWTARPLDQGAYVNLVRRCIRRRDAEGLRWLFD